MKAFFWLLFLCCLCKCEAIDIPNRIWVDATINGKQAKLVFDTGADGLYLFQPAAERLKLRVVKPQGGVTALPGTVHFFGIAEECKLVLSDSTGKNSAGKVQFRVIEKSQFADEEMDGVLGWPLFKDCIFQIQFEATNGWVKFLERLPKQSKAWTRVRLQRNATSLLLEIPEKDHRLSVCVDTGSPGGVKFTPKRWREWKTAHSDVGVTLTLYGVADLILPGVAEESWVKRLSFGSFVLTDVPIMEDSLAATNSFGLPYDAMFGLSALVRMDLVVDGKHGFAYMRPKNTPSEPPSTYNRAGVVFTSRDLQSYDLVAHVLEHSPAYEAGVRDGDIIMKFDGKWRTSWDDSPNEALRTRPAGTKLELVLKRGDDIINATVSLRDMLAPNFSTPTTK